MDLRHMSRVRQRDFGMRRIDQKPVTSRDPRAAPDLNGIGILYCRNPPRTLEVVHYTLQVVATGTR